MRLDSLLIRSRPVNIEIKTDSLLLAQPSSRSPSIYHPAVKGLIYAGMVSLFLGRRTWGMPQYRRCPSESWH